MFIISYNAHFLRCDTCRNADFPEKYNLSIKVKIHPRTGHESPEGEKRYRCTLSLTSALEAVGGQRHAPARLPPVKTQYSLYRRMGRPHGSSGRVPKISPQTGIRSPDHPARSESL